MIKSVTVLIPLSRAWRIDAVAQQISELKTDGLHINVVVIVDNKEISTVLIENALHKFVNKKDVEIINTFNQGLPESYIEPRRERIASVLNFSKTLIPKSSDFVFVLEDDTSMESDTLLKLMSDYDLLTNEVDRYTINKVQPIKVKVGFISGVQCGRWGYKIIGAWKFTPNYKDAEVIESIPFSRKYILQEVDAAGLYCCLTTKENFMNTDFVHNDFGPDVNFGTSLKAKGYRNFIDWTCLTGHVTKAAMLIPDEECVVVRFEKKDDRWRRVEPAPKSV